MNSLVLFGAKASNKTKRKREKGQKTRRWVTDVSIYELSAREIYDTYAQQANPAELLNQSRMDLAARLRLAEGLSQEEALYAADQIQAQAQQIIAAQEE